MASNRLADLSQLDNLDQAAILEALRSRYSRDEIYTKCGEILIAVNPYKKLKIFELKDHEQYDWKKFEASAPPHIFNVAARAYQQMRETNTNQVILVSGESGAGKTESTKLMVKHFVHMCPQGSGDLHEKVIEVNPLLEAFGNAQTIMNDNSSRFAKFLEISFEENGQVLGAVVRDYMLEKSRVVNYSYDEGNFHIFYSLFAGASSEQLSNLQLKEAKDYKIMTFGSPELLKQTDVYKKMYTEQMSVLKQIGFNTEDMDILHCMLGSILHLTEVKFKESEKQNEALEIVNSEAVTTVAKLLEVDALDLGMALIKIKTDYGGFGGEQIHCLKSLEQAKDGRDALAKAIYERLFGWIIRRVNEDLNPSKQRSRVAATIGVLDIAGFENLHFNSFEQLCINFVNERLQNFMNDSVFKTEKAIYDEEGIPCEEVNFTNNMNIIELFTQKPFGILNLLDEETTLQQGSDGNFVNNVINNHSDSVVLVKISSNEPQFGIRHFAGTVTYRCEGFLEKNKDTLNDDLFDVMKESHNEFLQDLFTVQKGPTGTISETQFNLRKSTRSGLILSTRRKTHSDDARKLSRELRRSVKKSHRPVEKSMLMSYSPRKHKSVLSYFRESMNKLLDKMRSAEAHFVRCIKPNNMKQKENFNSNRVEEQLLYNGITEIAKIRRMGYPVRKKHIEFYKRYSILHPEFSKKKVDNPSQSAHILIDKILPGEFQKDYKMGKHRIFLKEPVHLFLEKCLYIRETAARRSIEKCLWKLWSKRMEAREQHRKNAEELERKMREKEREDREKKEKLLGSSIGSTTSTCLGSTIGSTMGSTIGSTISSSQGYSSSDSSSSGRTRVPFEDLARTRVPGGGTRPIMTPDPEHTQPKVPVKAPNPPTRRPPKHLPEPIVDEDPTPAKKKDSKEFWDIFANIPREQKTKDVHERGSLRLIKVITYGLLFLLLFTSLVFQKISLMLLVNKQNRNFTLNSGQEENFRKNEPMFKSARYLLLLVAVCIPYILRLLTSILKVLFGNLSVPNKSTIFVATFMECAHSVGLSYLVFKYLEEMHSARGIMVMSATCILPSIIKPFFAKDDVSGGSGCSQFCKKVTSFVADLFAIIAQISVIPLIINNGFLVTYKDDPSDEWETVLEIVFCLLLCSFSWWENFMDDRAFGTSNGRLQQFILQIKFDLQEGRPVVTFITSVFKIGITIMMAYLLRGDLDLDVSAAAAALSKPQYENNFSSNMVGKYSYIKDYTSIICITVGSYVAYYIAYTICKLRMQIVSFSLASLLSTPVAVGIVVLDCHYGGILSPFTKEELFCFTGASYDTAHWHHYLLGLLWLMSTYWIARYIWYPNQERLAKVDRLFVNPLYCSILLEQHLLMNRRRHNKRIKRDFVSTSDGSRSNPVYRLSSDQSMRSDAEDRSKMKKIPPMIYACATMWHENRLEMVQILKSLYRVDQDQFIRKQAVEIERFKNPDSDLDPEDFEYYEFQAHIMFDDAFEFDDDEDRVPNSFVTLFMEVMQEAANAIHHKQITLAPPVKIPSPYGAQLVFDMPGENMMYVHLKDKNKIRHRKRWSQVMYMYYLLGYRIVKECQERVLTALEENRISDLATWNVNLTGRVGKSQIFNILDDEVIYRAENTFILALDGDVDFTPKAVRLLIDRMQKNEELGAACGRIHPIGKGPMVWYQKFEYAVAHWLQKSTEHVLGCVLCSPGCFSMFRGSALMDDNIMRKYTIKATEASHHLMYDQGEDRWLCTLLLQQGYRVDYAAASDAYTYAPEGFGEFFNQRRRWMPSTIANIMDLLADAKNTVSINNNISWLYMVYQGALMVSTLIGPGTVVMMISGAYVTVFKLNLETAYAIALTPAIVYTILCFTVKSKYQIMAAEILSAFYSFIMMVVFVGSIITAAKESPFHPSVIFLGAMMSIFLFAAILHPWEFSCIIYGALYFLCVPSGFLLLVIYSLCNMNVISWGTREVPKKKTKKEIEEEENKRKEKEEKKKQGWFNRFMPKFQLQDLKAFMDISKKEDNKSVDILEQMNKNIERLLDSKGKDELTEILIDKKGILTKPKKSVKFSAETQIEDETEKRTDEDDVEKRTEEDEYLYQREKKKRNDLVNPKWLEIKEFQPGTVVRMNDEENTFWENFIEKYLEPLDANPAEQKKITKDLKELRNNVTAGFFFINLIWIAINFMFQLKQPAIITFPIAGGKSLTEDNKYSIKIDGLGLMFVIFFIIILLIQFIGMIVHRWGTFMHLIAITEIPNPCSKNLDERSRSSKNNVRNAKDMIRLCAEIVGEPMPDYPSDEDDNLRNDQRTDQLMEKINNTAMLGVAEDLRKSQKPMIGRSLRDTRNIRNSQHADHLRRTFSDRNFQKVAANILARTRQEIHSEEAPAFTPNVLRQRGNNGQNDQTRERFKIGNTKPAMLDFIGKVQERNLDNRLLGMQNNIGQTFRPSTFAAMEDNEPLYDEIPGAGTMSRAFHKKVQKMARTMVQPSESNGVNIGNNFELRARSSMFNNDL